MKTYYEDGRRNIILRVCGIHTETIKQSKALEEALQFINV